MENKPGNLDSDGSFAAFWRAAQAGAKPLKAGEAFVCWGAGVKDTDTAARLTDMSRQLGQMVMTKLEADTWPIAYVADAYSRLGRDCQVIAEVVAAVGAMRLNGAPSSLHELTNQFYSEVEQRENGRAAQDA